MVVYVLYMCVLMLIDFSLAFGQCNRERERNEFLFNSKHLTMRALKYSIYISGLYMNILDLFIPFHT